MRKNTLFTFTKALRTVNYTKILVLSLLFTASLNAQSTTPITNDNIHTARDAWDANPTAAEAIYGHISDWDVSNVTTMVYLFRHSSFNGDISRWDVSNVTDMKFMFEGSSFNQDISNWDVSNVTNMSAMFYYAQDFNQPIGNWDVYSVTDMQYMFAYAQDFNQPIGNWDVSKVTDMSYMFYGAKEFNQPIGNWDVSKVTNMSYMFYEAEDFDQDLTGWCVTNITSLPIGFYSRDTNFVSNDPPVWGTCPVVNVLPTDITLSASAIDENVATATTVGSFSTTDADTTDAHTYSLVAGAGDTNNASFTIDGVDLKTNAAIDYETNTTLSIRVQTNDGTATFEKEITITVNDLYETNPDFTLDANGVTCNCDNANFGDTGDLTINGVQKKFTKRTEAELRTLIAAEQNDPEIGLTCTSGITDMSLLFVSKTTFNEDISSWDVSSVTNMDAMFDYAASFNQPIGNWDVSSVTMMQYMFTAATKFNQDISGWDVSSVTYMDYMFWDAEEFDQDIGNWDVSSVNSMDDMFSNTEEFDQDLTSWCVTNITSLPDNFATSATKFDTNNFPVWGSCPSSNATPTDITLSANTIDENVATATTVGSFSTTDADTTDAHTYSLVAGTGDTNNASFTIDGADLKTNAAIDYETNTTLSIRVQTNDGAATFEKEITITVNDLDDTPPTVVTQDITVQLDANGSASITPQDVDNGSSDNSGNFVFSFDTDNVIYAEANERENLVLQAPAGTVINAITFASYGTPTGSSGNYTISSCHASNSLSIVEGYALGNNSATISVSNNGFGDPCGGVVKRLYVAATYSSNSNSTSASFSCNNLGDNTVILRATDGAGNTASATATVTVEDNIAPTISLTGDASVTHEALTPYTDLGATTADNCSAILTVTDDIDVNTLGTYTVTYTATDASGNETTATRTVEVVDTTIPVITLTGDNPQIVDLNTTYTELGATANDNYDGDITNNIGIDATAIDLTTINCYPVTYNVNDASSNAATTVTRVVFVLEPGKPFAKDDASTVNKNSLGNPIYVLANDSYGTDGGNDNHPLTFSNGSSTNASLNGGQIAILDSGTPNDFSDDYITYSPSSDFVGEDSFTYVITDSSGDAVNGQVVVTVVEGNNDSRTPSANDDTAIVSAGSSIIINVLGNDTSGAYGYIDNGLTATNGTQKNGTEKGGEFEVNTNGTNATSDDDISYTPKAGFFGTDTFSYTITDVNGNASTATVTITVNAVDLGYTEDVATVDQDSTGNIIDVMANDSDDAGYGSADTRFLIQSQDHLTGTTEFGGTVALKDYDNSDTSDDVILYTPRAGFVGIDTFYYVPGSDRNASVLVTITVEAVVTQDDVPEAMDDTFSVVQNGNSSVINVLDNDIYGDNGASTTHPLTFSNGSTSSGSDQGGLIEITNNGTTDTVTYTPAPGFVGTDSFDYVITDADGDADTATVTITVTGSSTLNQPAAADDAFTVNENATDVEIGVLSNDNPGSDGYIDNGLTATNGTQQGGTTEDGFFRIDTKTTADTTDDVILYTPKAGFTGTDTFQYIITDASGDADTATVTVTVEAVTDVPNANDDTATTAQDTAVTINVTDNDQYGINDAATSNSVVVTSAPTNGTASVVGDDIEYTPNAGFVGTDTFTYAIEDSNGDTDSANVTVTVTQRANGVPVANDDTVASIDQNSVDNTIDVLANDDYGTDGPNDDHQLTFSNGGTASASNQGGAIRVVSNTILYSPATDFVGEDKFTYVITDKNGDADAAEVTITVVASGQASTPTAVDDSIAVDADSAETLVDVMANDTIGIDGYMDGGLTMPNGTLSSASTEDGLIRIDNKGTSDVSDDEFFYMPKAGFTGTDTFKYTITDATGDASTATVTVTVASVVIPRSGNGDTSVSTTSSSFVTRNDFTAYPNPSTGYVKTTIFSTTNTDAEILLFDITGKVILRKQTSLTMGKNELELNLNIKPGIMLLRVQSPETNYGTTKIVFK